jgi:hypothetical protein
MSSTLMPLPTRTSKRKRSSVSYVEQPDVPLTEADFVQPKAKKQRTSFVQGRSASAPPVDQTNNVCYDSFPTMPAFHTYVEDSSMIDGWNDPAVKKGIRLSYQALDPNTPDEMHHIFIQDPAITGNTCPELPKHLKKIMDDMETPIKDTTATEATGEAAAALYMAKMHAGSTMLWGAHLHSGAGIDQIWHSAKSSDLAKYPDGTYYVVEAKGVGAQLGYNKSAPDEIKQQMSAGWVYHNLATMLRNDHTAAKTLMPAIGLQEELKNGTAFYSGHGGASKNYYKCQHDPTKQKAELIGITVEAVWRPNGQFAYKVVDETKYH